MAAQTTEVLPDWPLSSDWRFQKKPYFSSNVTLEQCARCRSWLYFKDGEDRRDNLRKHYKGLKCKKGREVLYMESQGYRQITPGKPPSQTVRKLFLGQEEEGKFYTYYPAEIVSFVRWASPEVLHNIVTSGGYTKLTSETQFLKEQLAEFLALKTREERELYIKMVIVTNRSYIPGWGWR